VEIAFQVWGCGVKGVDRIAWYSACDGVALRGNGMAWLSAPQHATPPSVAQPLQGPGLIITSLPLTAQAKPDLE